MKAFTDISQSKKLAEILPLESADMYYAGHQSIINPKEWEYEDMPKVRGKYIAFDDKRIFYPCWSLAALLGVVPYLSLHKTFSGWRCDSYNKEGTSCILGEPLDNPVDACYEMIIKLHEQKLL